MTGYPPWFDDLTDRSGERPPPPDDACDLDWRLYLQGGVLTTRQAESALTRSKVRHLIAAGRWQRLAGGIVVAHNGPLTRGQQLWAAVLRCGEGAVLGGLTAACTDGLVRAAGPALHLLVPAGRRPHPPGSSMRPGAAELPRIVVHRSTLLPEKDIRERASPPRTTIARSLVDAAQWAATDDEARAIVVAGCQQRLTTPDEILAVVERMRRAHRRSLVLETIGYAALGAEAVSEIDFVKLCRAYGLPRPDLQTARTDRSGRLRYRDASRFRYRLHAEVDGGYHLDAESYWSDMQRQNALWIDGDRILRFPRGRFGIGPTTWRHSSVRRSSSVAGARRMAAGSWMRAVAVTATIIQDPVGWVRG